MKSRKQQIQGQLHVLEDEIIQVYGLIKVLEKIQPDDGGSICLVMAIEEKLTHFQNNFYKHWEILTMGDTRY